MANVVWDSYGGVGTGQMGGSWRNFNDPGTSFGPKVRKLDEEGFDRQGQMLNWMKGLYGKGGGGSGRSWGNNTPQPSIDTSGIWSPAQVQQRVNASAADTNRGAATAIRGQEANAAARGYGTGSPLAAAMRQMGLGQAAQTNAQQGNDVRWNAAAGNRQTKLDAETARSNAWAQAQNARNQQWQIDSSNRNALLAAMSGMV